MSMSVAAYKRTLHAKFKNRGWSINSSAINYLVTALTSEESGITSEGEANKRIEAIMNDIGDRIDKHEIKNSIISAEVVKEVNESLRMDESDLQQQKWRLHDAFSMPRLSFDATQKVYSLEEKPAYSLHGSIQAKAGMYRERLHFVLNRALRSGMRMRGMSNEEGNNYISTIESLLGDSGDMRILIGILTQPEEGKWFLEDLTGAIWLDFSDVKTQNQDFLYTEGAVVAMQGCVSERNVNRLAVRVMDMVPVEARSDTLLAMDIADPLDSRARPKKMIENSNAAKKENNVAVVVISDCCFGNAAVCDNLRTVFEGYEEDHAAEIQFVLLGPFTDRDFLSPGGREAAAAAFAAFGEALTACPRLCENTRFLLVPSPKDPGTNAAWPRRPLPAELLAPLRSRQKNPIRQLESGSNPCRLSFYTQEIVIFREDLLRKMQRHSLQVQGSSDSLQDQVIETILAQGHLFPLPPTTKPITWDLDYTMRLHPLPSLLIMADHTSGFRRHENGVTVLNPGSFAADASFAVYYPAAHSRQESLDNEIEMSGL